MYHNIFKLFILILTIIKNLQCQFFSFNLNDLLIASGTIWCGAGNKAKTCDDLGEYAETDKCCRSHDMCPYTFSSHTPSYNGYTLTHHYTVSHCECDLAFYECLHEKPYKSNSYYIWTSFDSLEVKCFAYLPCHESEGVYDNIWSSRGHRKVGKCHNGSQVMIFDNIRDYSHFFKTNLLNHQLEKVKDLLVNNQKDYITFKKKTFMCFHQFSNLPNDIANNFEKNFLPKPTTTAEPSTTTITTTQTTTTTTTAIASQADLHTDLNEIKAAKEVINTHVLDANTYSLIRALKQTSNNQTDSSKTQAKNITIIIFLFQILVVFSFIMIIFVLIKFFNKFFK